MNASFWASIASFLTVLITTVARLVSYLRGRESARLEQENLERKETIDEVAAKKKRDDVLDAEPDVRDRLQRLYGKPKKQD